MSLTRKWEGNKEDWTTTDSTATIVYTGPWSSRITDKNSILGTAHPSSSAIRATADAIEQFGDASDAGGPMTAKHTVTFKNPTANPDDKNNPPQNVLSDWQETWQAGGEAITIGLGFHWNTAPKDKITKEGVSAVKMFPSATISVTGTTSKLSNSGSKAKVLSKIGKVNHAAWTLKGYAYEKEQLLFLGSNAEELGKNAAGSDLYKMTLNFAYRYSNTWNEFWREKGLAGGADFDELRTDTGDDPVYALVTFSDLDPKNW